MRSFASAAILAAMAATPALAAETKAGGTATYVTVSSDSQKLADGRTLVTLRQDGVIRDNDPQSPLNLSAHDCMGTIAIAADGKSSVGGGSCTATDKDGDIWWLWWTSAGATGAWGAFAGTGKYAGISGGGTITYDANLPDRIAVTYSGTLTMK
jgi:hypothetical protein